jgi:hypothetical protein
VSLTIDRLLDEQPDVVYLKRVVDGKIDDYEYEMDCTFPTLKSEGRQLGNAWGTHRVTTALTEEPVDVRVPPMVRIVFSCQPWGAAVIRELDDDSSHPGAVEIELLYDTEGNGEGQRDIVLVRGFTPGYNDPDPA